MGGGKNANNEGSKSYDYFGTIAGAVCWGPVQDLLSVIIDGAEVWPRANAWTAGETIVKDNLRAYGSKTYKAKLAHTASTSNNPPNATYWDLYTLSAGVDVSTDLTIDGYGDMTIFWGTDGQTVPVELQASGNDFAEGHPPYKNVCYVLLIDFLFGRERVSAPNLEVVVRRRPAQTIITGDPSDLTDGQANLMAIAAEIFTSQNGLGMDDAMIDTYNAQQAADALDDRPELVAVSSLLTSQDTFMGIFSDLALLGDVWLRFNPDSELIEAGVFTHGTAPSVYTTITVDDLADRLQIKGGGWSDVKTRAVVSFTDRDRAFKESSDKADDLRARFVLGEDRAVSLQRDFITRRDQAIAHAAEYLRTAGKPKMTASMSGRREKTRLVRPGDYIRYDIDIEPGGAQLLQYFKVVSRSIARHGPNSFEIEADGSLAPIPYTPGTTPVAEDPISVDAIANQRIFEASVKLAGASSQVMVLAERPSSLVSGFHFHYDSNTAGVFQRLGTQTGFATRATLHTDLTDSATTISIDVAAQVDTDRLTTQPGALGAADDQLLAIILPITAGYIDEDSDGYAEIEICSVSAQALVSGSNYNLTVLRARQGTIARAFTHGSACEVWLISRAALIAFSHGDFETLRTNRILGDTPDTAYFRLQPFTYIVTRDLGDCSSVAFRMPLKAQSAPALTLTAPASNPLTTSTTYPVLVALTGEWNDLDFDIVSYEICVACDTNAENVILSETTAPTGHVEFDEIVAIDAAGTYVVRFSAYDFAGNVTNYYQTIIAGAGTAKPAKPIFHYAGEALTEYAPAGEPVVASITSYGCFGRITATSTTFGATITYGYRTWNYLSNAWTAFSAYSATAPINSSLSIRPTNGYTWLQIRAKATRGGVDSDVATVTMANAGAEIAG
jgi:hypothetical protein